MPFNSPDLNTFKAELENNVAAVLKLKTDTHANIKIQSLLNITIYVAATRFLEGSVKHIVYNCCKMRGDNNTMLNSLESDLKRFNNPEFANIKSTIQSHLGFDIIKGLTAGRYAAKDISLLDQIVINRHRNVHATHDSSDWYNTNIKDITGHFNNEYPSLEKILTYLDAIMYDPSTGTFID